MIQLSQPSIGPWEYKDSVLLYEFDAIFTKYMSRLQSDIDIMSHFDRIIGYIC